MPTDLDMLGDKELYDIFVKSLRTIAPRIARGQYLSVEGTFNKHHYGVGNSKERSEIESELNSKDAPNFIIRYSTRLPGYVISYKRESAFSHEPLRDFIKDYDFVSKPRGFSIDPKNVELLYVTVNETIKASQPKEEVVFVAEDKLPLVAELIEQAIKESYADSSNKLIHKELDGTAAETILKSDSSISYLLRFSKRIQKHVISYKNGSNIEHVSIDQFIKDGTILKSNNEAVKQLYARVYELLPLRAKEFKSYGIKVQTFADFGEQKSRCMFLVNGKEHIIFHEDEPHRMLSTKGSYYGDEKLFNTIIKKPEFIGIDDASGALVFLEQHSDKKYAIYYSECNHSPQFAPSGRPVVMKLSERNFL